MQGDGSVRSLWEIPWGTRGERTSGRTEQSGRQESNQRGVFTLTAQMVELRRYSSVTLNEKFLDTFRWVNWSFHFLSVDGVLLALILNVSGSCPHLSAPCIVCPFGSGHPRRGAAGSGPESPCDVCRDLSRTLFLWCCRHPPWGAPVRTTGALPTVFRTRAGLCGIGSERAQPRCPRACAPAPCPLWVLQLSHGPSLRWPAPLVPGVWFQKECTVNVTASLLVFLCPVVPHPLVGSLEHKIPSFS